MDNLIYSMVRGKMVRTKNFIRTHKDNGNFLITCEYGDWSGFRTLSECEKQFPELEKYYEASGGERTYKVVER